MLVQVFVPQLPKSAERGLSLLANGELVAALQVFDSQLKSAASNQAASSSSSAPSNCDTQLLQGLAELCQRKLGLAVSSTVGPNQRPAKKLRTALSRQPPSDGRTMSGSDSRAPVSHPMTHLIAALRHGAVGGAAHKLRSGLGVSGYREQRAADAAAVGHALAFLMHPAVYAASTTDTSGSANTQPSSAAAVHRCLIDEALAVLASKGNAAFSSTTASPLLSGATGGSQAGSSAKELRTRAGRSMVLLEMLEMTGLEPVKEQMLNLADQVCTATV
jgi:hypothetical protein